MKREITMCSNPRLCDQAYLCARSGGARPEFGKRYFAYYEEGKQCLSFVKKGTRNVTSYDLP